MGGRGWVCDGDGSHGAGVGGEMDGAGEERASGDEGEGSEEMDGDGNDIVVSDLNGV